MFPELRQKAIDEAHAALLSTPTQTDPSNSKVTAKRRQTAHGRLEGSIEQDIYAFNASDDDFHPNSGGKKRKRPSPEITAARTKVNDDDNGYEEESRSSKKRPIKRAKSMGGMSVLDLLNDTSEDDWRPNTSKLPTSGRKSTRGNTVNADLLPPLPKPKRKPRETAKTTAYHDPQFDGSLSLGFSEDRSITRSAEIQVAATEPTSHTVASTFMIDLTHDELVLQNERRAEYHALSPGLSIAESLQDIPRTNAEGTHDTPDLNSTIPDPPYDQNLPPSQIAPHLAAYSHIPEPHPLAPPSVASDSPLSSLESSPAKPTKKPKQKKRAATDQHLGLTFVPEHGFGNFPVASEWRAAKGKARQGMAQATYAGRAKTSNAVDLFAAGDDGGSEVDDIWTGNGKAAAKKKKPAAKRQKITVNDGDGLGAEIEAQKTKPKRRKSKVIETVIIGDTEDELSGGSRKEDLKPEGIIQVAATASAESPLNPQVNIKLNTDEKSKTSEDEPCDTIAASNSPHVGTDNSNQSVSQENRPPGHRAGVTKVHRWGRPKFLDELINMDDSSLKLGMVDSPTATDTTATDQSSVLDPLVIVVEQEPELLPEPAKPTNKAIPAKRRKSKKDESEEEDWTGDLGPSRKPVTKKEVKIKTPRVTKKAAAAAAKEAKEQKEKHQLFETIKDSDDEEDLEPTAIIAEPELEKPIPVPEPAKDGTKKVAGKKEAKPKKAAKVITTSKETVSDTDDEEDEKKKDSTPVPQSKPETAKEEPQTPSKKLAEKAKKTPHSPINKGPVKFRVGLSRRAHIEPLLKIIRK